MKNNTGASSGSRESSQQAVSTKGFDPARIPWHQGVSDECYGVRVWVSRIENLRAHFRIIRDYLPADTEMADWLKNQVNAAIAEANRYIDNCCPEAAIATEAGTAVKPGSVHEGAAIAQSQGD